MLEHETWNIMISFTLTAGKKRSHRNLSCDNHLYEDKVFEKPQLNPLNYDESHKLIDEDESRDQISCDEASKYKDLANEVAMMGNYEEALRLLLLGSYLDPCNYFIQDLLAQVYLNLGKWIDAVKSSERAVSIAPTWIEGYLTLARCRRELGEVSLACESYLVYLKSYPADDEATAELAEMQQIRDQISRRSMEDEFNTRKGSLSEEEGEVSRCLHNLSSRVKPK
jgi:tetratricopeptide (TPR) repeat protein